MRPKTSSRIAQKTTGIGEEPVETRYVPFPPAPDAKAVVGATAATVVVEPAMVEDDVDEVVVDARTVVVVAPDRVVVVVAAAATVVVVVCAAGTAQVMPDGWSAGVTANVNCTFQYLSSCVADAAPSVHA